MARRLFLFILVGSFFVAGTPALAHGNDDFHRTGQYRARTLARWALGASPSPLLAALDGDCGDLVGGVFFLAPPIAEGIELRCRVPRGVPIVFSHAAWFTSIPADGDTDQEIIGAANSGFDPIASRVTLDGERVGLAGKTFNLGAFDVRSETGSFYDLIGVGTGTIRTSLTGTIMTLPPQRCGRHVLRSFVDFGVPGEVFSGTWWIKIANCDD